MKKMLIAAIATLAVVVAVPVSAFAANGEITVVSGTVRAGGTPVSNADVDVSCNGHVQSDMTNGTGGYVVQFPAADCPTGATVTASATKGGATGNNSGTANQIGGTKLNVAVVDVDVALPEMGTIVGGIAALGAGAAFMVVRRKQQSGPNL